MVLFFHDDKFLCLKLVPCHQIRKLCSDPVSCKLTSAQVTCVVDENVGDVTEYDETTGEYGAAYDYSYYEEDVGDSHELHNETETITFELNVFNEMEYDSNRKKYLLEAKLFVYGKYCWI